MAGVDNLLIANNTVVRAHPDGRDTTWIAVTASKDHRPSRNVVVRNNIATVFRLAEADVRPQCRGAQLQLHILGLAAPT